MIAASPLEYVVFVAATIMMLGGGIGVVSFRNPVHSALSLVLTLFGVAVHFVAQEAHFLAAVQVIVYAGAIVVLFLFVIMLLGVDKSVDLSIEPIAVQRPLAAVMSIGLVGLVTAAVLKAGDAIGTVNQGTGIDVAFVETDGTGQLTTASAASTDSNIQQLAVNLYTDHLLAFELTSVLLIVAVAGTVLLTRKWPKADAA
ncbi:MAG: NADH-quinone oxidoreductase subunit J [Candidatus Aldehydirespiratoraceae bacterium]|jgi:NADH-quinone oxidoreductase subunit J